MKRRVLLSGASGMLGKSLAALLAERGAETLRLVRRAPEAPDERRWDPERGELDPGALDGVSDVVHLSGEPVAERRWTDERKRRIVDSRTASTGALVRAIEARSDRPRAFVQASAIGFYGTAAHAPVDEGAPRGEGFLAEVVDAWEQAGAPVERLGVRWVAMRIGVALSPEGGALGKLLPIFRLGAGGPVGDGRQMLSWVTDLDVARAFLFAIEHESLRGPVNVVAPEPVDNATFSRALGRALGRPAIMRVPALAIRAVFGEMGVETVLASQNVVPNKLLHAGFTFTHPSLAGALSALLAQG